MQNMDSKLKLAFDEYILLEQNVTFRNELINLAQSSPADLAKRLLNRMEFGTAGLRARIGAGFACMNDLTLVQTGQGLFSYMQFPDLTKRSIVVGFDGRHHSDRWARLTANIFRRKGVKVYLYSAVTPTPFVPFAIRRLGAAAGVMVTASHNPKEDNGYKVYWDNGAQIKSPHDRGIADAIIANLKPWEFSYDFDDLKHDGDQVVDPLAEMQAAYYEAQTEQLRYNGTQANSACPVRVVYTAMHGVGTRYVTSLMSSFGFPDNFLISVPEQAWPDPEFPTVRFPNPEEGRSCLDLACRLADKEGCPVILANDPDADRLAVAEVVDAGASAPRPWRVFTGNETAALLGWWCLTSFKRRHPQMPAESQHMLFSTVSSRILAALARREGAQVHETLTGFKYMGNEAHRLLGAGQQVVFAFEEAIGFMCGSAVLDKDGVSAAAVCAELVNRVYSEGKTLAAKLAEIYAEYGWHVTNNGYFFAHDPTETKAMFAAMRDPAYPTQLPGIDHADPPKAYDVLSVRDVSLGFDSGQPDRRCVFPASSGGEMLTLVCRPVGVTDGATATVTLRTSGTEPKLKWYSEIVGSPGCGPEPLRHQLDHLIRCVHQHLVRPELHGFKRMDQ
uniref:Phosphoglucomutase n=1 Tax=Macrostomum lignano TaxID=282301 RepID=A0A1I8JFC4_9PLAT